MTYMDFRVDRLAQNYNNFNKFFRIKGNNTLSALKDVHIVVKGFKYGAGAYDTHLIALINIAV